LEGQVFKQIAKEENVHRQQVISRMKKAARDVEIIQTEGKH
jgi:hypothetical protein